MRVLARTFSLLTLSLALAGCLHESRTVNAGILSVHQPVVTDTTMTFALGGGSADADRAEAWFEGIGLGAADTVAVEGTADRLRIGEIAAARGARVIAGTARGPARIVVIRATANVPGCPDWRRGSYPELSGSTTSNFGCAVNANFAAMVADPNDLVIGRTAEPGTNSEDIQKAVRFHRETKVTGEKGLKQEASGGSQ